MAKELRMHGHVVGNWKNRAYRHRRNKNSGRHKKRPGMSPEHLACIRKLPCTKCWSAPPNDPHHLKFGTGERGTGLRATDRHAVPLCRQCHDEVEDMGTKNERAWFGAFGIKPQDLADCLWRTTGDVDRMTKVLEAHKE